MMLEEIGRQQLAEAIYGHIRSNATRAQMATIIHELLAANDASDLVKDTAIRMAMIYSAEEGHS